MVHLGCMTITMHVAGGESAFILRELFICKRQCRVGCMYSMQLEPPIKFNLASQS